MQLFNPDWHEKLNAPNWSESIAREAIIDICSDLEDNFDAEKMWPLHPDDLDGKPSDPLLSLYNGASGAAHALFCLNNLGLYSTRLNAAEIFERIQTLTQKSLDTDLNSPGIWIGQLGTLLCKYKWAPSASLADEIQTNILATQHKEENEFMWGAPGGLMAAIHMMEWTKDENRWLPIIDAISDSILQTVEIADGAALWNQKLYDQTRNYLGAAHGLAGNFAALACAQKYLSKPLPPETKSALVQTLINFAQEQDGRVNWPVSKQPSKDQFLSVQFCHGAPGIIVGMYSLCTFTEIHSLFLKAAECIWSAGPLQHETGLCHGTAGNGYAFLRMHQWTKDKKWLDRARAFAMHALKQSNDYSKTIGRRRFAGLTGDMGLALYLADCIEPSDPRFPFFEKF